MPGDHDHAAEFWWWDASVITYKDRCRCGAWRYPGDERQWHLPPARLPVEAPVAVSGPLLDVSRQPTPPPAQSVSSDKDTTMKTYWPLIKFIFRGFALLAFGLFIFGLVIAR